MTTSATGRVALIGAGNMAEALARGWVRGHLLAVTDLIAGDPSEERRAWFQSELGIRTVPDNAEAVHGASIVVLAVKPQRMVEVLTPLRDVLAPESRVISIAAGIPTRTIEELLGFKVHVIRAMPNTPALVGAGVTALCAGAYADEEDWAVAESLLGAVGPVLRVGEEDMDAVTALSGSGPAYVFYLVEAWLRAAERLGLSLDTARVLTTETLAGAARLLKQSGCAPEELRRRVTSKGGTTEAALQVLENRGVGAAFEAAILAAAERSRKLSGTR